MSAPDRCDELDAWIVATAPRALAHALALVGHRATAEDLVHDCYGRLLARRAVYDLPRDGNRLLFKAITHACINFTQRRPGEVSLDALSAAAPLADPSADEPVEQAIRNELSSAIAAALQELPVKQRALVQLRGLGHSLVEAAEMLDISHANARVQLHRARQSLAARLGPFIQEHAG